MPVPISQGVPFDALVAAAVGDPVWPSRRSRRCPSVTCGCCWLKPACRFSAPARWKRQSGPRLPTQGRPDPGLVRANRRAAGVVDRLRWDGSGRAWRPTAGAGSGAQRIAPNARRADYGRRHRHALRLRCLRRPPRPAAGQAQAAPAWQRHARVHDPDPSVLSGPPADLLDPGQPLSQLDAGHPHVRGRPQDRARGHTDLRQLPRIPSSAHFSAITQFVVANADYLDWDAFAFALARHITYRNGDHRDRRLVIAENRHRIAA